MATPALARFGTHELKTEFLTPSIAGDIVACLGVSEAGSGSDVASVKTTALPKKGVVAKGNFAAAKIYNFVLYCKHILLCFRDG